MTIINEKMLAMLTDKELENEDLQDKFDKYIYKIKKDQMFEGIKKVSTYTK